MNLSDSEIEFLKNNDIGKGLVLKHDILIIYTILHYNDRRSFDLALLLEQSENPAAIKSGELNLLELAIFQSKKAAIWTILEHTKINITTTLGIPWKFKADHQLNALLYAVTFEDKELLDTLELRTENNVPKHEESLSSLDDDALSITLMHTNDHDFFRYILSRMHHRLSIDGSKYFNKALMRNDQSRPAHLSWVYELNIGDNLTKPEKIAHALCNANQTCNQNLVCNNLAPSTNSLHIVSNLEGNQDNVLDYLFKNGGHECWQIPDINGKDAFQIALENSHVQTVKYYHDNVLPMNYKIKHYIRDNTQKTIKIMTPNMIVLGLIFILAFYYLCRYIVRFFKKYSHNFYDILRYNITLNEYNACIYKGPLDENLLRDITRGHIMALRNIVERLDVHYKEHPLCRSKEYYVPISTSDPKQSGQLPNRLFTPSEAGVLNAKILFYIPGTASSVRNPKIEEVNASHLANALDSTVLLINHRLAPEHHWPTQLDDVCNSILYYCKEKKLRVITLAGYSIGGYLATLASIVMYEFNIKVDRLILFAPVLDLGGEFRSIDIKKEGLEGCGRFLPKKLKENTSEIEKFQSCAKKDELFNKPDQPFTGIIAQCFHNIAIPPVNLRKLSPTWFDSNFFESVDFPDTTIITGENDYFRVDAEVFFEKLSEGHCSVEKIIIPNADHELIWKKIYPIYMAQNITYSNKANDDSDFTEITNTDAQLVIKKGEVEASPSNQDLCEYANKLKILCKNLHILSLFNANRANLSKNLHETPQYMSSNY